MDTEKLSRVLNTTVSNVIAIGKEVTGDVFGLELELEGRRIAMNGRAVKGWTQHNDGSLRGESIEYVFSKPLDYKNSVEAVERLFAAFAEEKVVIKNSYRCSTHVHINFSDKLVKEVVNFFCLYTIMEEILEQYCGDERKGNLFCLSNRDVEPVVNLLSNSLQTFGNFRLFNDAVRYCGLNLCSLNKFGTIELRTMRGATSVAMVREWLDVIVALMERSRNIARPVQIVELLSHLGAVDFVRWALNDNQGLANLVLASYPCKNNLHQSLYSGARLIQLMAYQMDEAYQLDLKPEDKKKKGVKFDFIGNREPINVQDYPAKFERVVEQARRGRDDGLGHVRRLNRHGARRMYATHSNPVEGDIIVGTNNLIEYDPYLNCYIDRDTGDQYAWCDEAGAFLEEVAQYAYDEGLSLEEAQEILENEVGNDDI